MWCAHTCASPGAQRMVDIAACATPAVQFKDGITFLTLLEETFKKLAEAHAAELRRVQLEGGLRMSSPGDDRVIPDTLAEVVPAMEVALPRPRKALHAPPTRRHPRKALHATREALVEAPVMFAPAKRMPAPEWPTEHPPQIALRAKSREDDVSAADEKRASDDGECGQDNVSPDTSPSQRPPCTGSSTPPELEVEVTHNLSNAISASHFPMTLLQRATDCNVKLHAIEVTISSAGDLRDADFMPGAGTSDPYCVCQIKGKPDTRFQTHVINDNCHPVWNHHCVVADFEEGDILEFLVYDSDVGPKEDDLLGAVELESHMHFPLGFDGTLYLTVPRKYRSDDHSTLTVKVVPRDYMVEPDDDRAMAALQRLLDAGARLWPELFPCYEIKLTCAISATNDSMGHLMDGFTPRSESIGHGTIIRGRGRLERAIVMHPFGSFQGLWDVLSVLCVFYDVFHVPFVLAFDHESSSMKRITIVTTSFWTVDLVRSCFCGYYHDGIVEMRLNRILMRYLKSWFAMDFSLVALDWVGVLVTAGPSALFPKMMRVLHVLRAVRALSIIRVAKMVVRLERICYGVRAEAMRAVLFLATCMFILIVGCHLLACGFYRLGLLTSRQGTPGWVLRDNVHAQGYLYSYTTSVHWAFTQFMPASSGINPGNEWERFYVLLVDIVGFMCFSFFLSNVQMQLQGLKKISADARQRDALLRRFFTDHGISLTLSKTIFSYINKCAAASRRTLRESEVQVLTALPKEMHVQLRVEMYGPVVNSHPFFMGLMDIDMICFRRLCHGAMTEIALEGGEEVFVRGNKAHSMYFISGGHMLYKRPGRSCEIKVGDWACEPALWFPLWTHRGNLHTVGAADLVQVCAATFAALVFGSHAPTVRQAYVQIYAAAFVRGGEAENPTFHHSDVWSNTTGIDRLVTQCKRQATSVTESQLANLWYESLASENQGV